MFGRERKNRKLHVGGYLDDLLLQMKGLLKSSLGGRVGMHQRALYQLFLILKVRHQATKKDFYTTGREIIAKKKLKTHRLSGKPYKDLDSTIVIIIFYLLNDIIVVLIFTMVAEFELLKVKYCLLNVPTRLITEVR